MTAKIKFLSIKIPVPWNHFCRSIKEYGFDELKGGGFDLFKVTPRKVVGVYTEKKEKMVWFSDINGDSKCEKFTTFERFGFSIERDSGFLRVDNPPRSLKGFSGAFFSICGPGFYLDKVSVDPVAFSCSLKEEFPSLFVRRVELKNVVIKNSASASMIVVADKDVTGYVGDFLKGKDYSVFRVEAYFNDGGDDFKLAVSSAADLSFSGDVNSGVFGVVESVMLSFLK